MRRVTNWKHIFSYALRDITVSGRRAGYSVQMQKYQKILWSNRHDDLCQRRQDRSLCMYVCGFFFFFYLTISTQYIFTSGAVSLTAISPEKYLVLVLFDSQTEGQLLSFENNPVESQTPDLAQEEQAWIPHQHSSLLKCQMSSLQTGPIHWFFWWTIEL